MVTQEQSFRNENWFKWEANILRINPGIKLLPQEGLYGWNWTDLKLKLLMKNMCLFGKETKTGEKNYHNSTLDQEYPWSKTFLVCRHNGSKSFRTSICLTTEEL